MKLISNNETHKTIQATNRRVVGNLNEILLIQDVDDIDNKQHFLSHIHGCKFNLILIPHYHKSCHRAQNILKDYLYENGQIFTY